MSSPSGVTLAVTASVCAIMLLCATVDSVLALTTCELPAAFALGVEERPLLDTGSAGLLVLATPMPPAPLRAGDVLRQANDRRMLRCADLEAAAGEALAKGLVLLLAAEREGRVFAVVLPGATAVAAAPLAPVPAGELPSEPARAPHEPVAEPRAVATTEPVATATPVVLREVTLPPRADASAELAAKAVAAAAVLGTVDEAARLAVPLGAYERRIEDAKNAIAALRIEGEGGGAVRSVVAEAFGYHETARDIRRYKAAELSDKRVDQRGAGAASLPYFSDSTVPRWVEQYPFLSESLQQAPRTTHMLLPGEMAGRWNPDQAVELLWERAAKAAGRLSDWAR